MPIFPIQKQKRLGSKKIFSSSSQRYRIVIYFVSVINLFSITVHFKELETSI
ncbi:MAG TPA: hypothetical protein PK079_07825 [Leptospiraceae bacterium]|nr:hypothetical protein [Leptospiraceae bacterium]HMZ66874.1 hypothetical protein [Leptospiraceae bacterium]HNA08477.1 hypothetical protein [Leptospiraceae bacterium]HNC57264.1 hypothetical protein [Leptospiraceae bacterium]HNE53067.1 hypothetical protein [Leptospiraceae bacterium]